MKRLIALLLLSFGWAGIAAAALTCPSTITGISPTGTSCWPMQETTGTTINDVTDSNSGTISGGYTLNQGGGIACNAFSATGCNIATPSTYASSQPMSVVVSFAGTGGGLLQLGSTSSLTPATTYYALYLDTYGRLTFGSNNYGIYNVIQSMQHYNDGNQHVALATIGAAGMKLYVDGRLVAQRNAQLANYAAGYWFFGGINTPNWPYAPPQGSFNGTLFYAAWWNGTQLTDTQGTAVTGPNLPPITNNYATITGSIASLSQETGYAYANQKLTFQVTNAGLPGCSSTVVIAPSTQSYQTDSQGNLPSGLQLQQGAHVNMFIGASTPIALVIPCQSSVDLWTLIASQTDPSSLVNAVAVAGPLFAGTTVTNPPAGAAGTATITAPASFSQTQSTAANVDIGTNGNVQQVILSGNAAVNLTDFASGANFIMDITENGTGGYSPAFTVPAGWTLQWPGGGSQPAMPSTAANAHNLWQFVAISATQLAGAPSSLSSGVFPLASTANFNDYSGININSLSFAALSAPTPNVAATCTGTCATTYTYEITCLGDNSTHTLPSLTATGVNAASLSSGNHNLVSWSAGAGCYSGYNVYGRVGGSLGFLGTTTGTSFNDDGTASPGASPPTSATTGSINGSGSLQQFSINNAINVQAMGAVCDGATNNQAAFQSAINSLSSSGGTVYVPSCASTYNLSSSITVPRNVIVAGAGVNASNINCTATSGACVVYGDPSGGALTTIRIGGLRDLTLLGNGGTSIGLYLGGDPAAVISPSNYYGGNGNFYNVKINGFNNNIQLGNNAALDSFYNILNYNATGDGFSYPNSLTNSGENIRFYGGQFDEDTNTFEENASTNPNVVNFFGTSFDFSGPMIGKQLYASCYGCHFENLTGAFVNTSSSGALGNSALYFQGSEFVEDQTSGTTTAFFVLNGNLDKISVEQGSFGAGSGQTVSEIFDLTGTIGSQLLNVVGVRGYGGSLTGVTPWLNTSTQWSGAHIDPQNPTAPPNPFISHGQQLFTGSGTFTVPVDVYSVTFECWGAGGGGGGVGAGFGTGGAGGNTTVANAGVGGATLTCNGGTGGTGSSAGTGIHGSGGAASNGTLNLTGGMGYNGGAFNGDDNGGSAPRSAPQTGAAASPASMGVGGSGGGPSGSNQGGGGGGGAYAENVKTTTPGATFTVTVGSGGTAGTGATTGAAGVSGGVLATW